MYFMEFEIIDDYIELYQLLKVTGVCGSGGEAKHVISNGLVKVDGIVETRKKCKIYPYQTVVFDGQSILVTKAE